ncbi:MAG: addiction module protein [Planctomycetaceae bacterium]
MPTTIDPNLLQRLMALPEEQRSELAGCLIQSLDDVDTAATPEEVKAAWTAELNRRAADIDSGAVSGVPYEERGGRSLGRMSKPLSFHPEAINEATEARRWYASKRQEAADGFLRELRVGYDAIAESPTINPYYAATISVLQTQAVSVSQRVFRERDDAVDILAVAHAKREPGYWMNRDTN